VTATPAICTSARVRCPTYHTTGASFVFGRVPASASVMSPVQRWTEPWLRARLVQNQGSIIHRVPPHLGRGSLHVPGLRRRSPVRCAPTRDGDITSPRPAIGRSGFLRIGERRRTSRPAGCRVCRRRAVRPRRASSPPIALRRTRNIGTTHGLLPHGRRQGIRDRCSCHVCPHSTGRRQNEAPPFGKASSETSTSYGPPRHIRCVSFVIVMTDRDDEM